MSKDRRLYKEIITAVKRGKATNFARGGVMSYPDIFFSVGKLDVCIYNPGKTVKVSPERTSLYGSGYKKIWWNSFRLRRALRYHNPEEYRQFYLGQETDEGTNNRFINLVRADDSR